MVLKRQLFWTVIFHLICREEQGKFPDYPSDEEGGSAAIFHPETVTQVRNRVKLAHIL